MLTAKNLQCMRGLLVFAHCQGSILGSSWQLVLTTVQVFFETVYSSSWTTLKEGFNRISFAAFGMDLGFETVYRWQFEGGSFHYRRQRCDHNRRHG